MNGRAEILGRSEPDPWSRGRAPEEFLRALGAGMSNAERLAQVRMLARMLDDSFSIPGTRIRFGWDSVLGFVPGLGDVVGSTLALLIVHHAWQSGASKLVLARMLGNVAADFAIGAVPVFGDVFDLVFKASRRNVRLLEQHLNSQVPRRSSR